MYIVYTCVYLYIPSWTLNTDFVRIWMQDTTVGAWVVMLHEQCMGWVPSNISYEYACMYMHILVCTCHIHVCTVLPNHVQVVRIPDVLSKMLMIMKKLIAIMDTLIFIIGYYWDPIIANNCQ